jgi:predicted glycoside hydrolase/deacetylase ChbG (UPF0249 family)
MTVSKTEKFMKHLLLIIVVLCVATTAAADGPRLIVRGDDMGAAHAINEAIIKCHQEGIQTSIEVIIPSPWFPEAVKMLAEQPNVDVGVHLALTSEWDNIKWRPLTDAPSIRDSAGFFFPMIHPNKNYPDRALAQQKWDIRDIEKELRAQIELAMKLLPNVSHLSSHMGCTGLSDETKALLKKLRVEYRLDIEPAELGVKGVGLRGPRGTSQEKIDSFIKMLDDLEAGNTYMFVEHPGLDTPEMRAIHHIGYENVAVDRQGVTDAWTSPKVREAIRAKGIQLISYRDLVK